MIHKTCYTSDSLRKQLLGKRVGTGIQHAHEARGVAFHLATSAAAFLPSRNAPDQVGSIQIEDGTVLPADLVLVCIGSKPATGFLKDSGVPLLPDGSVVVDRKLRVQGIDSRSVFAAGKLLQALLVRKAVDPSRRRYRELPFGAVAGLEASHPLEPCMCTLLKGLRSIPTLRIEHRIKAEPSAR